MEEIGLPPVDHIDWLNGFEWKGIYFRIHTEYEISHIKEEIKSLNYAFFEYIQIL